MSKLDAKKFVEEYGVLELLRFDDKWDIDSPWHDPRWGTFANAYSDAEHKGIVQAQEQAVVIAGNLRIAASACNKAEFDEFFRTLVRIVGADRILPKVISDALSESLKYYSTGEGPHGNARDRVVWVKSEQMLTFFLQELIDHGWIEDEDSQLLATCYFVNEAGKSFNHPEGAHRETQDESLESKKSNVGRIRWLKTTKLLVDLFLCLRKNNIVRPRSYWIEVSAIFCKPDGSLFDNNILRRSAGKISGGGYRPVEKDTVDQLIKELLGSTN